jgi:hypothetical protein
VNGHSACVKRFRTPVGVGKSPKNEAAGRELLLLGFMFLGRLAGVDVNSHGNGGAQWLSVFSALRS